MWCKLSSARSLSKASNDGDLSENMANADIRASDKAMSGVPQRWSPRLEKASRTKANRASAERYWCTLGATIAIETSDQKRAEPCGMGFQFGIAVGEKTRGRQRFNGLRELLCVASVLSPFPGYRQSLNPVAPLSPASQ